MSKLAPSAPSSAPASSDVTVSLGCDRSGPSFTVTRPGGPATPGAARTARASIVCQRVPRSDRVALPVIRVPPMSSSRWSTVETASPDRPRSIRAVPGAPARLRSAGADESIAIRARSSPNLSFAAPGRVAAYCAWTATSPSKRGSRSSPNAAKPAAPTSPRTSRVRRPPSRSPFPASVSATPWTRPRPFAATALPPSSTVKSPSVSVQPRGSRATDRSRSVADAVGRIARRSVAPRSGMASVTRAVSVPATSRGATPIARDSASDGCCSSSVIASASAPRTEPSKAIVGRPPWPLGPLTVAWTSSRRPTVPRATRRLRPRSEKVPVPAMPVAGDIVGR